MKTDCNIIKDLLPLYAEGMLSEQSNSFVEEHLRECPDCRMELDILKKQNSEDEKIKREAPFIEQAAPIKKVKKKIRKRGLLIALISIAATAAILYAYVMLKPVSVDYGSSQLYSRSDIDRAVSAVKLDFSKMVGCKLFSLSYAGDEISQRELEIANRHRIPGDLYTDCIVLKSVFRSPIRGGGAWNANELYYWSWILARKGNGSWVVIDKGYA